LETKQFIFNSDEPVRLDKYLTRELINITRSRIQRLINEGYVLLNGKKPFKTGVKLEKEDLVIVQLPSPIASNIIPEKIPLDIIFENDNVIVVNKPAGMVVHPSAGHDSGTLVHALLAHAPFLEGIGGIQRPGIVHRLDKNTSGILIVAKNDQSHRWLQKEFKNRNVEKIYHALVDGLPITQNGKISAPIYRDRSHRKKMAIAPIGKGKTAETKFFTEKKFTKHSYLRVHPLTGRTHQIRVHLASIQLPIAGDTVYGYKSPTIALKRHFLHASSLKIRLPGESEITEFSAKLPLELLAVIENLE